MVTARRHRAGSAHRQPRRSPAPRQSRAGVDRDDLLDAEAPLSPGNYVNGATVRRPPPTPTPATTPVPWRSRSSSSSRRRWSWSTPTPTPATACSTRWRPRLVEIVQLDVAFSEELFDPVGDTDPNDVTNPANYRLVEAGRDGLSSRPPSAVPSWATTCPLTIDSADLRQRNVRDDARLHGGTPLADGLFRLFVCGTVVEDLDGNPLDGDGDGTPGDDFIRHFRVRLANPIDRPHFDFATDLDAGP